MRLHCVDSARMVIARECDFMKMKIGIDALTPFD
jgi:hypothetical protein